MDRSTGEFSRRQEAEVKVRRLAKREKSPRDGAGGTAMCPAARQFEDLPGTGRTVNIPKTSSVLSTAIRRKLTAKPRASYDMDPIAWGAFPDNEDFEEKPTCVAAELAEPGSMCVFFRIIGYYVCATVEAKEIEHDS